VVRIAVLNSSAVINKFSQKMREALGGFRLKNGVCSVKGSLSST
jgi:hypothetical protein